MSLDAHRLEGAGADVQRDERARRRRASRSARQQRVVEVQAGGGRGHRAGAARVDRLVARASSGAGRRARCRAAAARGRRAPAASQRRSSRMRARRSRSSRDHHGGGGGSASTPNRTGVPACGLWLARSSARARAAPSTRSTSTSTRPPLALRPNSRALITRVSFSTSRSPGCEQLRQVGEAQVGKAVGPHVQQALRRCARPAGAARSARRGDRSRSRRASAAPNRPRLDRP